MQDFTREGGGALVVALPRPVLDEEMVALQSDPARIEVEVDDQWLHNLAWWMDDGREEAVQSMRRHVVELGSMPSALHEAEDDATARVEGLLQRVLDASLRPNVRVKVVWR